MKKYLGIFKIYNGETTYTIPVGVEAENLKEAKKQLNGYVCENNIEIWRLRSITEITNLEQLWELVR